MRTNPDSEANQEAARQNQREVFALQRQALQDAENSYNDYIETGGTLSLESWKQKHELLFALLACNRTDKRTGERIHALSLELGV